MRRGGSFLHLKMGCGPLPKPARAAICGRFVLARAPQMSRAVWDLTLGRGRGDGKALLADLQDMRTQLPLGGLLHVHGTHQAGHLAQDLTDSGIKTRSLTLYKQDSVALSDDALTLIAGNAPVVAPLFSPRSAQIFAQAASHARAPLWLVALSPAVDAACALPAAHRHIAANPNATAMCNALADLLCQSSPTPAPAPLWPPISDA